MPSLLFLGKHWVTAPTTLLGLRPGCACPRHPQQCGATSQRPRAGYQWSCGNGSWLREPFPEYQGAVMGGLEGDSSA